MCAGVRTITHMFVMGSSGPIQPVDSVVVLQDGNDQFGEPESPNLVHDKLDVYSRIF